MENQKLDQQKIKANAISAYLLLFISPAFLLNKQDPYLNNDFVKSHTKIAFLIHSAILITLIIFIFIGTKINISIFGYTLDQIIAISLFFILTSLLGLGIIKARAGEKFKLGDSIEFYKNKGFIKLNQNGKIKEQEKLNIIISKIPFLGFLTYAKNKNNKIIENNIKLNVIITFFIILLYTFGNQNLANLFLLFYIIYIVFSAINLFSQNKIISFDLNKIPNFQKLEIYYDCLKKYLLNYFSNKKDFKNFSQIIKNIKDKKNQNNDVLKKELEEKDNFKLPKIIIYIPILNLISLFNYNSKQKIHIINGVLISVLFIIIMILSYLKKINCNYLLFLLFPIFAGLGELLAGNNIYKIPFLFKIFEFLSFSKNKTKQKIQKIKELSKEEKSLNLKVED